MVFYADILWRSTYVYFWIFLDSFHAELSQYGLG
jgi:hypothetical protein